MIDERLSRRLRSIDVPEPPDPAFVEHLFDELASELRFPIERAAPVVGRVHRGRRPGWLLLAAMLLVPLAIGAVLVGAALLQRQTARDDLLTRVRATGRMGFSITREYPQAVLPGGAIEGFDVDMAREIGRRLGLEAELVPGSTSSIPTLERPWDVALSSSILVAGERGRVRFVEPIYYWPFAVLVAGDSPASTLDDLADASLGAVPGSTAERWLLGEDADVRPPPPVGAVSVRTLSDLDCLDRLAREELEACVAVTLGPADLEARPDVRVLAGPVPVEVRGAVVRTSGPDSERLAMEVRRVVTEAREDGTIADLSRRRFRVDLTAPPPFDRQD